MQVLPTTTDEGRRLVALAEFEHFDAATEVLLGALARLAATTCAMPLATITLLDANRRCFQAHAGVLAVESGPQGLAFCACTVEAGGLIEIRDAAHDPRFASDPLVTGGPKVRHYAGVPLMREDGTAFGALGVFDRRPRALSEAQRSALGELARLAVEQLDLRRAAPRDAQLAMQNRRLTALTAIARSIFAALDPRALVEALGAGARDLLAADARLLVALPAGGFAATTDLVAPPDAVPEADPFLAGVTPGGVPLIASDELRAAVGIAGPAGETRYILDLHASAPLQTPDIFAIGLLAQYVAVAARNVELYGELQARRAAVVELNQVKNDLIAMLAHDFKGPLTTIVGFADVLAEDDRFDDESRKFLAMISASAMRLASLATDTLALSRLEQNELTLSIERFDVVSLIRDIVRVFGVTRHIELIVGQDEIPIEADPARLRQAFENLIGNAIKYSPGGEPVEVIVRPHKRGVEVSVRDHGIGIPEADMPKLFGRFARAQNAHAMGIGGTGFGLYLTKTIIEMHGGTVDVESREGAGSTFHVFVPKKATASAPQHRRFVLLDPAGDARSYVAHTLRDAGFATTVVESGEAVLDEVDETQFDAALIDTEHVGMPLDEFVRRIAGRAALIRIDSSAVDDHPGWHGALVKPFLTTDLQAAIDAAIARHPRRKPDATIEFSRAGERT